MGVKGWGQAYETWADLPTVAGSVFSARPALLVARASVRERFAVSWRWTLGLLRSMVQAMIPQRVGIYVPTGSTDNQRRHGRVRVQGLTCALGEVMDLSASGMRVRRRWKPPALKGVVENVRLVGDVGCIELQARVAWVARRGLLLYEAGFFFLDLHGDRKDALLEILRCSLQDQGIASKVA